jgi:hypothetical protein
MTDLPPQVLAYQQQIDELNQAAGICRVHELTNEVNGIKTNYPRWPEAWAACEKVWRNFLEVQNANIANESDLDDHEFVEHTAAKLR